MTSRFSKALGAYLLVGALAQAALYLVMTKTAGQSGWLWLFYFDPRIGIFYAETLIRGSEPSVPGFGQWFSAVWILALGALMVAGRPVVWIYLISELMLSVPSLLFFALIALANMSSNHGFSVRELFFPVLIWGLFSLIPFVWALAVALRQRRNAGVIV